MKAMSLLRSAGVTAAAVWFVWNVPANADVITGLGPALDYHLIGTLVAGGGPAVPNPGVDVSLNPQPLPPVPDPNTHLDLTDPGNPVYTNPAVASSYVIDWGMNAGGAVSFNIPHPGDPLSFTATNPGGQVYNVAFSIGPTPPDPGSFVSLNPQPLPPFPDPGFSFIQLVFSLQQPGDPMLTFQVTTADGRIFAFAPRPFSIPEPATLALLLPLGALAAFRRRKA